MSIAGTATSIADTIMAPITRRLRLLLVIVLAAAIVHILATYAAPMMSGRSPYSVLRKVAANGDHAFSVLPAVTAKSQPLPFLGPDFRYAVCPFNTGQGVVNVTAKLGGQGWSLSLYTPQGDNFYTAVGQDGPQTEIALQLTPITDRFLGLTPEAQGRAAEVQNILVIPARLGIAVLRAPDRGIAFANETEAMLRRATCVVTPF